MVKSKWLFVLLIGSILLVVILACAKPAPVPAPAPQPTTPAVLQKTGGVAKVIYPMTVNSIGYPPGLGGINWFATVPCIETLLKWAENSVVVPSLATGWEATPDKKGMIIKLRKDVKFHDGTEFNAEAAKYNLDLQLAAKTAGLAAVTSIDIIDNYTIRLNLSQWSNAIPFTLVSMDGMMVSPTALKKNGVDWAKSNPVGTGAFKFVKWDRDVSLKYEKFPDYWQKGKPYLDGVEIIFISDANTASTAFQAKEADILWGSASTNAKPASDLMSKGFKIDTWPSSIYAISPDSKNISSPFADKRVREALEYAIDKDALAKAIGFGIWDPLTQPTIKASFSYNPDLKPRQYDPAQAKKLLTEAGYPSGFKYKLIGPTFGNKDAMVIVQRYLNDVGINIEIQMVGQGEWDTLQREGWKDAILLSSVMASGGHYANLIFRDFPPGPDAKMAVSVARPQGFLELVNQTIATTDEKEMMSLSQKIVKMLNDDATWIPLWVGKSYGAKQTYVRDDKVATINMLYWSPENAWLNK